MELESFIGAISTTQIRIRSKMKRSYIEYIINETLARLGTIGTI